MVEREGHIGYLHISNLYKEQLILLFKECYALEKIHGTSAHITFSQPPPVSKETDYHEYTNVYPSRQLTFFSGGESYNNFIGLFDKDALMKALTELGLDPDKNLTIYGEAYGGSQQGMSKTYGPKLKFAVFDIQIGNCWLSVPDAHELTKKLGLEFVHYIKVSTDLKSLDEQRDAPSVQAIRNDVSSFVGHNVLTEADGVVDVPGVGRILNPKKREGVVLRPLIEVTLNNGERLICKHKGDDFKETTTARPVVDPAKMAVLEDANAVANEWVTATRLTHVLDKLTGHCMEKMREIIAAMTEDVLREGKGEIVESDAVKKSIGKKTVDMYKNYLKSQIK